MENLKYKAAIFDYDGTVVDSMPMWTKASSEYVRNYLHREPAPGLDERIKRMSLEDATVIFREEYGDQGTTEEILNRVLNSVIDHYKYDIKEKPGMIEILQDLNDHGVRCVVATASLREMIEACNRSRGLEKYFEEVFSCSDVGANKHQPDVYYKAAEFLGVKPEETLVFEDVKHAAATADLAGFKVIGVRDEASLDDIPEIKAHSMLFLNDYSEWPGVENL